MLFFGLYAFLLTFLLLVPTITCNEQEEELENLRVGQEICVEGFVMDTFCINRGTLLDNPSVVSLEEPDQHSVHCLVDISSCYTSPFEMLVAPVDTKETKKYSRGWRFDDAGRQKLLELGRDTGDMDLGCTTCTMDGELEKGFRAALKAKVLSLNLQDDLLVPELSIIGEPIHSNTEEDFCDNFFGMVDILNVLTLQERETLFTTQTDASFRRKRLAHGSMMLIGWGILLPNGILFARFFKHRPDGLWFRIHKMCQPVGLLFALTGWLIALINFDVFGDRDVRFVHGVVGSIVMSLGLLQPLNAYFRPHLPHGDGEKTFVRVLWEHYHRGAGWTCFFLAILVIFLGTTMLPDPSHQLAFQIVYIISLLSMIGGLVYMKMDSKKTLGEFFHFGCCNRNKEAITDDKKEEQVSLSSNL
eukprot:scaffold363_cov56-Cylindrotheca_fusiformis.AAC.30